MAVEVKGLSHSYGKVEALRGVDLQVGRGKLLGVVGPNGGGKTTLFKVLATLVRPGSGEVRVLGHDLSMELSEVRKRIGVVFQSPAVDKKLTVLENLSYHGRLYGLSTDTIAQKSQELLTRFGLTDRKKDRVDTLSGGLQRRLEIAKSLLTEPELLLLDEPTTGLDPAVRRELWQVLDQLRHGGLTILITTHLMDEAERCDWVVFVHHGQIVDQGRPETFKTALGKEIISIRSETAEQLEKKLSEIAHRPVDRWGTQLRIEVAERAPEIVKDILNQFRESIETITLSKPTLEDYFFKKTGELISGK